MNKLSVFTVLLVVFAILSHLPLYAAEGESSSSWDFIFQLINFVVLAGLLFYFARKPIGKALSASASEKKNKIEDARKNQKQAQKELDEFRKKLVNMKKEAEQMVADAKEAAEVEKVKIIKEGEAIAEKLKVQVRVSIEQEYNKATLELKKWAAGETIKLAEEQIKKDMKKGHQTALFDNYINKLN